MPGIMQMVANNVRTTVVEDADYTPPNFVSSGLTAYYDPANPSSYSGSGSTLTDLSGNGIDGSIVGATYTDDTYFTLDGVNDYMMRIYNRWGELLYQSDQTRNFWDGKVNGKALKQDAYIWEITYEGLCTEERKLRGHVILLK